MLCQSCPLNQHVENGSQFQCQIRSRGQINPDNPFKIRHPPDHPEILIVGEAPGRQERKLGFPFVGDSGKWLDHAMIDVGMDMSQVRWTNIIRCLPLDDQGEIRSPNEDEIKNCLPFLLKEIIKTKPKYIVTVGNTATQTITGRGGITKQRGQILDLDISNIIERIYPKESDREMVLTMFPELNGFHTKVVPIIHPAAVLRGNRHHGPLIREDISMVSGMANNEKQKQSPKDYQCLWKLQDIKSYFRFLIDGYHAGLIPFITLDVETFDGIENGLSPYNDTSMLLCMAISHKPLFARMMYAEHPLNNDYDGSKGSEFAQSLQELVDIVPVSNQNIKFDYNWLLVRLGVKIRYIHFDTMTAHHYLVKDLEPHNLDYMTAKYFPDLAGYKKKFWGGVHRNMLEVPHEEMLPYNCADADGTWRLTKKFTEILQGMFIEIPYLKRTICAYDAYKTVFLDPIKGVADLDRNGIYLDRPHLEYLVGKFRAEIAQAEDQILSFGDDVFQVYNRFGEFNIAAPQQMAFFLHEVLKIPVFLLSAKSYNPAFTRDTREKIVEFLNIGLKDGPQAAYMRAKDLLNTGKLIGLTEDKLTVDENSPEMYLHRNLPYVYKLDFKKCMAIMDCIGTIRGARGQSGIQKMITSYLNPVLNWAGDDGLVHADHLMIGARTDRFSARSRPIQTIPNKHHVKEIYKSRWFDRGGLILETDESQAELRVICSLAGEDRMIQAFHDDVDIHRFVAASVFKLPLKEVTSAQRYLGKLASFATVYGGGAGAVAQTFKVSASETEQVIKEYFSMFPKLKDFSKLCIAYAKQHEFTVSPFGTMCPTPGISKRMITELDRTEVAHLERISFNAPIQGASSNLVSIANNKICHRYDELGMSSKKFGFVHDSLETDVYPGELIKVMQIDYEFLVADPAISYDWLKCPLKIDYAFGSTWGHKFDVASCDLDQGTFSLEIEDDGDKNCQEIYDFLKRSLDRVYKYEITPLTKDGKNYVCDLNLREILPSVW